MVKFLPEFEYFTVFLKNRNFSQKLRDQKLQTMQLKNILTEKCPRGAVDEQMQSK